MDLVTGAVVVGVILYASGFFQGKNRENEVARAIDPITGNPAIMDPLNHAHYGNNLNTPMPVQDPQLKRVKPFDKLTMSVVNSKQYLTDLAKSWRHNYWDRNDNIFIDRDFSKGNWMNEYLSKGARGH